MSQEKKLKSDVDPHRPPANQKVSVLAATGKKLKVCVAGGGGFIGSHIARRLKKEGHYVVVADWAKNDYFEEKEFCDEFHHVDLRVLEHCVKAVEGCDWVFGMACDMGGMGFIQSNHATILFNNFMISFNMVEACRRQKVAKYFYSSSACVYPEDKQMKELDPELREHTAWPANPQDAYGLEKIVTEKLCYYYGADFPETKFRVGRFHNIYGPQGTWKGGREKAPAAFCRKAAAAKDIFEVWGDGKQTRSFCYVDDCVEGVLRLMVYEEPGADEPINIGSDEMVSMNDVADLAIKLSGKPLKIEHKPGPEGVRGRNSNNDLIKKKLGWSPTILLKDGLKLTYDWVKEQVDKEAKAGVDVNQAYAISHVVAKKTPDQGHDKNS